jgi:tetraacyldisaccharide 4'-kinase
MRKDISRWGDEFWRQAVLERRGGIRHVLMRCLCRFLSAAVSAAAHIRGHLYRSGILPVYTLGARVVSVGNICLGGTGKTPVVEFLARGLNSRGVGVAILTRGYGRKTSRAKVVLGGRGGWKELGDEPLMLSRSLPEVPIVVNKNRVSGGQLAIARFHSQLLILDDGLQHLRLARDMDIVVIDASAPFGNGKVFPAGDLRENLTALRRAHLFFVTKVNHVAEADDLLEFLRRLNPEAVIVRGAYRPAYLRDMASKIPMHLSSLKDAPILAMSGIGSPISFERSLEELGARLVDRVRFPDHHAYRREDLLETRQRAEQIGARFLITTEKDAVRLPAVEQSPIPLLSLGIEIQVIAGESQLWECVERGI